MEQVRRGLLTRDIYLSFTMPNNMHILEGLPKQLLLLLGTITSNNKVNNWCIYENLNNQTCITIRFNDCEAIEPVYYRRISQKQAKRNIDRASRHINTPPKQSNINTEMGLSPGAIATKKRKIISPPENTRDSDIILCRSSESPNVGFIDSPILPVKAKQMIKAYESAEIANESFDLHSISEEPCSPNIQLGPGIVSLDYCNNSSVHPSTNTYLSPPNLKIDGASQVEYDTQDISTQVDRPWFQSNQITQCSVKLKTKLIQTKWVKSIDESVQAAPEPTVYEDACIQHHVSGTNKCTQSGPAFFSNIDNFTQMSPALKPDKKKPADDVQYLNASDLEHSILCPCCDQSMTIDHECEPEIDQNDSIVSSHASTQNRSVTSDNLSTPITNVTTQIQSDPQPNPDPPERNYEGVISFITAWNDLLTKKTTFNK